MARYDTLPQICVRCRQLKLPSLGTFLKGARYNTRYWICHACAKKPAVKREARACHQETPIEKTVREALLTCGFKAVAEFKLDPFIYDFAIPKLRLLLEVDSPTYHNHPSRIKRDQAKTKLAEQHQWELVRLRPTKQLGHEVLKVVWIKAQELGFM